MPDKRKTDKPKFRKPDKVTGLLGLGLSGILLVGLAPMLKSGDREATATASSALQINLSAEEYASTVEERLCNILGKIEGVGTVEVMVTLKSGYLCTYAVTEKRDSDVSEEIKSDEQRKTQEKNTTEQSYVLIGEGDSTQPLVMSCSEPEVKGVVVVCDGGGDPLVVSQVTSAVKVALDISSARITVSKRSVPAK